jgi:abortive infection bacteriophage resistance protein
MCVEIMYFNQLSKIFQYLKNRNDRTEISKCYDLPENIFSSWLHTINYVRNVCAHHSRLWNRDYHIVPMKLSFSKKLNWISNPDTIQRSKTYFFLCILNYLLQVVNPTSSFKNKLKELFKEFPKVNLGFMGFPNLWESENIWK